LLRSLNELPLSKTIKMKKLLFLFIIMNTALMGQKKMTLIYIGDPMCSWCYGLANEWETTYKTFEQEANIELIMGGLRPYNKQTNPLVMIFWIEQIWPMIRSHLVEPQC